MASLPAVTNYVALTIHAGTAQTTTHASVVPTHTSPWLQGVHDQTIPQGLSAVYHVLLTEPAGGYSFSVTSGNTVVVPPAGLDLAGSGAARTLTVTPANIPSDVATITATIAGGGMTYNEAFVFGIGPNHAPVTPSYNLSHVSRADHHGSCPGGRL